MGATRAKAGGGIMNVLKKIMIFLVAAGVLLALFRVFNFDPFGIVDWIWSWGVKIVTSIADFLTGNQGFRHIAEKPK